MSIRPNAYPMSITSPLQLPPPLSSLPEKDVFINGLNRWHDRIDIQGEKKEAYDKIIYAYKHKSTSLSLHDLHLTSLPKEIYQLTDLTDLNISGNKITCLHQDIENLKDLKKLYVSHTALTSFPVEITKLTNLEGLFAGYNQIEKIPAEIGRLVNLKSLYLHGSNPYKPFLKKMTKPYQLEKINQRKSKRNFLPPEIATLTQLEELDLRENDLSLLPTEIKYLKKLRVLNLSKNRFTSIPDEVCLLTGLEDLNLTSNQLESLPDDMGDLKNLKSLDLTNNPDFEKLPESLSELTGVRFHIKYYEPHLKFETCQKDLKEAYEKHRKIMDEKELRQKYIDKHGYVLAQIYIRDRDREIEKERRKEKS